MPAGDDMGITSDDDEGVDVEEVKSESGFGTVIVVDILPKVPDAKYDKLCTVVKKIYGQIGVCLLYTSPSPRDRTRSRMPSSA